jgi:hypothetical protein
VRANFEADAINAAGPPQPHQEQPGRWNQLCQVVRKSQRIGLPAPAPRAQNRGMDDNLRSVESTGPSARDTFAAICTAAVAAVIFWAAVVTVMLLLLAIMVGFVVTTRLAQSIAAVIFAAFCVWLTVRIVNRRERWAIRLAIVVGTLLPIGLGSLYLLAQILDYFFGAV